MPWLLARGYGGWDAFYEACRKLARGDAEVKEEMDALDQIGDSVIESLHNYFSESHNVRRIERLAAQVHIRDAEKPRAGSPTCPRERRNRAGRRRRVAPRPQPSIPRAGELRAARNLWHTAATGVSDAPAKKYMNLLVRINLVLALAFTLPALTVGWALVTRLADEIDSTPARKQFLDACHALGRQNP